jgi:hypothetical protein
MLAGNTQFTHVLEISTQFARNTQFAGEQILHTVYLFIFARNTQFIYIGT